MRDLAGDYQRVIRLAVIAGISPVRRAFGPNASFWILRVFSVHLDLQIWWDDAVGESATAPIELAAAARLASAAHIQRACASVYHKRPFASAFNDSSSQTPRMIPSLE